MKLNPRPRLRTVMVVGAAMVGAAGLAVAHASPALADPTTSYIAVGSDTTENVMDAFAVAQSGNELGSYDAVNPVTQAIGEIITPSPGGAGAAVVNNNSNAQNCSFTRPDGSGQGRLSLIAALGGAANGLASSPGAGCVDIARSSSGPTVNAGGALVYIPFAEDAVSGATSSATTLPNVDTFTIQNLKDLYASCGVNPAPNDFVTSGGNNYYPNGDSPGGAGNFNIDLYLPQAGSGTLAFWQTTLGIVGIPACDHQTILAGPNAGQAVEENDRTAVTSDTIGYVPFSIAQWVSQRNHPSLDRRHSAVEHTIGGVSPCLSGGVANNCTAANAILNQSFPIH